MMPSLWAFFRVVVFLAGIMFLDIAALVFVRDFVVAGVFFGAMRNIYD